MIGRQLAFLGGVWARFIVLIWEEILEDYGSVGGVLDLRIYCELAWLTLDREKELEPMMRHPELGARRF